MTCCHKTGPDNISDLLVPRQSLTSTVRTRLHVSLPARGCADAAEEDGRRGSNVYEVNPWLWQFGGGKPHIGGLTIEETAVKQDAASKSSDKRRKETCEGSKGDSA